MNKSRQQFEEEFRENNNLDTDMPFIIWDEIGDYYYLETRQAWHWWQASRESVESQIKSHQFSQLVNDTKYTAIKYKDYQCLRDALSRVMRDSLIGYGVKIKNE